MQLVLCDAADAGVVGLQGDVAQVVELAADGELAELGDTREEYEAQVLVARLERGVELTHHLAKVIEKNLVIDDVERGYIVLVDQDDDAGGVARGGPTDESSLARAGRLG